MSRRMTVAEAQAEITALFPDFAQTTSLDALRATEYARLDAEDHAYLDYTGGGLHADTQLRTHLDLLATRILGNPHSASPCSSQATSLVERARRRVLAYFDAPEDEYTAIFTLNASGALRLVGESFPFEPGGTLLLTFDNHNSVNGVREFATARGATVQYAPLRAADLRLDREALTAMLSAPAQHAPRLFAFPAQSNFSGVKHPLSIVAEARDAGWTVLLDAAAYAPTNRLSVREVQPDFVSLSFYKMFGYPTGVGCLIARRASLEMLRRPWFAGGTVNFVTVQTRTHILSGGEASFEDGTLDYLGIPAVEIGLDHLNAVGVEKIQARVQALAGWLITKLTALRHGNGRPVVRVIGPTEMVDRGGTVTMNFHDAEGRRLDYRRLEELAGERGISLRTGCFCNPGAGETAEGLTADQIRAAFAREPDMTLPRFSDLMNELEGKGLGAVRVSFGVASNVADALRFLHFAEDQRDQTRRDLGEFSLDLSNCRVIREGA